MKIFISLFVLSFTTSVLAADSSWLLCKGKIDLEGSKMNIVINSVEHRAGMDDEGNDKRVNDITLIMGTRLIVGQLDTSNDMNGAVALATTDGASKFDGIVMFDYTKPTMILRGKLVIDEELSSTIAVKTTCEYMN
ncbi:hypothetical protein SHI21_18385 [Bacteriovorax sp. PP10]|uniref:Organic solvent tolerance-like N-terminal domain-containing protein n=1 Tax=Bacteriovorax antarcticus TaxID=3088717 RepID=A0ABU5VYQ5_9BACT|nr:hypothetical protein [Bacteriovorax sp. PP10]MEA9358209.1 hypothetical protein [Bacteriovorax sp. PP10]